MIELSQKLENLISNEPRTFGIVAVEEIIKCVKLDDVYGAIIIYEQDGEVIRKYPEIDKIIREELNI